MLTWIITGGVACGKSLCVRSLCRLLGSRAAHFDSDQCAAELLDLPESLSRLESHFGSSVLMPKPGVAGQFVVDRAWLRGEVFRDSANRRWLEGWMHPAILAALEKQRREEAGRGCEVFLAEVPLYYEIGACVPADLVVVVASSPSTQLRRLMEQRGLEEFTAKGVLQSQLPIADKVAHASVVFWNDGSTQALEAQISTLTSPFLDRGRSKQSSEL